MALGLAVLASVAAPTTATNTGTATDLVEGYQAALITASVVLLAAGVVGATKLNATGTRTTSSHNGDRTFPQGTP